MKQWSLLRDSSDSDDREIKGEDVQPKHPLTPTFNSPSSSEGQNEVLVLSFKDGLVQLFDEHAERLLKVSVSMPDSVNTKNDTRLANAEFELPAAPLKDVSRAAKSADSLPPNVKHRRLGKKFLKSFNASTVKMNER